MKKTSRSSHSTLNELNITPLLDLVFVLLVIFIISTPQLLNNLEMSLPTGEPPPPDPNAPVPEITQIEVAADGQTYLNRSPVTVDQLRQSLLRLKSVDPDPPVVVKGADAVDYQHMINVLDTLQQLDITKIGLATEGVASAR
jgi:biopolymer transport protein ExbD